MKLRALLFLAFVALFGAFSRTANAQAIKINTVTRTSVHQSGLAPKVINYVDCVQDDTITMSVSPPATGSANSLQIWVGTGSYDCSQSGNQVSPILGTYCWKVYQQSLPISNWVFEIPARQVVPHDGATDSPVTVDASACDAFADKTGSIDAKVFIMLWGSGGLVGTAGSYAFTADLRGPTPPTDFTLEIGDTLLVANWKATGDTDINGYTVYCEASDSCTPSVLISGAVAPTPLPETVFSGDAGLNSTRGVVSGLQNYTNYVCAVAGKDKQLNVGKLSESDCNSPQPIDGFFKSYRMAGGKGGGGYCSFGRAPASPFATAMTLLGVSLWLARRSRRTASEKGGAR